MAARQMTRRCRTAAVAAAMAGCSVLAACFVLAGCRSYSPAFTATGPPATLVLDDLRPVSDPAAKTYLGTVTGTNAVIGLVLDGAHVRAYVCDGTPGRAVTLADWFTGQLHDGSLDAVSGQHRVDLLAQVGGRIATGTITLADGRVVRFTAVLSARADLAPSRAHRPAGALPRYVICREARISVLAAGYRVRVLGHASMAAPAATGLSARRDRAVTRRLHALVASASGRRHSAGRR